MTDVKQNFRNGLILGAVLVVLQKVIGFSAQSNTKPDLMIPIAFGAVVFLFLVRNDVKGFFVTGFTGLALLIGIEIFLSVAKLRIDDHADWLIIYFEGFCGSMAAAFAAFIIVMVRTITKPLVKKEDITLENRTKIKLLVYGILSAAVFTYFILPEYAGISVPVFAVLQLICLWFVVPDKKRLWRYIPIFILSLNAVLSGNNIWRGWNLLVSIFLYGFMFSDFNGRFFPNLFGATIAPFRHFSKPFRWIMEANKQKAPVIKRVLAALCITVPVLILLLVLLSSADMVFGTGISNFTQKAFHSISFYAVWKIALGLLAGFYLFGMVCHSYSERNMAALSAKPAKQGDTLILNILLFAIAAVYTIFAVVQFRYLFAEQTLPYGLTYTEYARKGFFELLFLTGINIFIILLTVHFTKHKTGPAAKTIRALCVYLCAMTLVLLASSFYRMWLYNEDDGLTRLRFLVFGFLIFEGAGLLATFYYIIKPKFNIIAVYLGIGLAYYLVLNLVPMDYFVAKSQVDMYLEGRRKGVEYALTLSSDAAPQIARLIHTDAKEQAEVYFERQNKRYAHLPKRWQRFNFSSEACRKIDLNNRTEQ